MIKTRQAIMGVLVVALAGCAGGRYVPVEERGQNGYEPRYDAPADARPPVEPAPPAMSTLPERTEVPAAERDDRAPAYVPSAPPPTQTSALLALLDQAEQQERAGQPQRALAYLERAQRISPRDPRVYLQLARLRLSLNDIPRATQLTQRGLALAPADSEVREQLQVLKRQLDARR